jgi:hypothetical protein
MKSVRFPNDLDRSPLPRTVASLQGLPHTDLKTTRRHFQTIRTPWNSAPCSPHAGMRRGLSAKPFAKGFDTADAEAASLVDIPCGG